MAKQGQLSDLWYGLVGAGPGIFIGVCGYFHNDGIARRICECLEHDVRGAGDGGLAMYLLPKLQSGV